LAGADLGVASRDLPIPCRRRSSPEHDATPAAGPHEGGPSVGDRERSRAETERRREERGGRRWSRAVTERMWEANTLTRSAPVSVSNTFHPSWDADARKLPHGESATQRTVWVCATVLMRKAPVGKERGWQTPGNWVWKGGVREDMTTSATRCDGALGSRTSRDERLIKGTV